MTLTLPVRALAVGAAIATLAAALVTLPATPFAPSDTAAADNPTCLPGYFDVGNLINPPHQETDPDVGTYIAGDLLISTGASEMEGTFVIGENATFNSGAYFNVGTVGAGSQYVPAYGSDMLTVGGDLTIPSAFDVEVGNLAGPLGGNVVVGGSVSPADEAQLTLNGGTLTQGGGSGVITPYAPVAALYSALSTEFSGLADTGTVTSDPGNVYFTSTTSDTRQVFTVSGSDLGSLASTKTINLINIPVDAVIIINVTGTTAVLSTNVFILNGLTINPMAAEPNRDFSHLTQSMLWNFADATSVTLGRQDQLLGSVLVPTAGSTTQLLTSTNGRLYINGDLTLGGGTTETGLEIHNYPFRNCAASTDGSLDITKVLSDPSDVVDDSRVFTGTYTCVVIAGADITGTWSVTAGSTQTVTGLPDGATCSIDEDALATPPHATDTSYVWGTPTFSADQVIVAGTTVTITATNSFTRETGSFAITKALNDPDSVVTVGRLFTGTYTCVPQSGANITGTWSVQAGSTQTVTNVPVGSSCSITEDPLSVAPSSTDATYVWDSPSFSATAVTTTTGTVTITATNTVLHGVGELTVTKALTDTDGVVDPARLFTGTVSCTTGTPSPNTWSIQAGDTATFTNIPAGAVCTVTEDALTVAPSSTDSSYVWQPISYTGNGVTIIQDDTVDVTVSNEVRRALGNLQLIKVLDDPFDVVDLARVYTGIFDCTHLSTSIASGTWSTTAGAAPISLATNLPAGTVCSVAEDALTAPPLAGFPQYQWRAPVISPATIVITDGVTGQFTVTNIVFDPFDLLAHAGTETMLPLVLGGGAVTLGLLAMFLGYRRRRSA